MASLRLGSWPRFPTRYGTGTESWLRGRAGAPVCAGHRVGESARARFAYYLGQDAAFLDASGAPTLLCESPDHDGLIAFRELLDAAADELCLHRGYAAAGMSTFTERQTLPPRRIRTSCWRVLEPVCDIAAAMTPCMRLYAYLGQRLAAQTKPESPYREWVMTYSSAQFEARDDLSRCYSTATAMTDRLGVLYHQAMELELRFFDAAGRWERP